MQTSISLPQLPKYSTAASDETTITTQTHGGETGRGGALTGGGSTGWPPRKLPRDHSKAWPLSRTSAYEGSLRHIQSQFEPRLPLSPDVRQRYLRQVAEEAQLRINLQNRPGRDLTLRRRDASEPDGGRRGSNQGGLPSQSELLECEMELIEACEQADRVGSGQDVAASEATLRVARASVAAVEACAALAPREFEPILSRLAGSLHALIYSPWLKDEYGAPMLYKIALDQVASRQAVDASNIEFMRWELDKCQQKLQVSLEASADARVKASTMERRTTVVGLQADKLQARLAACERERAELAAENARLTEDAEAAVEGRIARFVEEVARLKEEIETCRSVEEAMQEEIGRAVTRGAYDRAVAELADLSDAYTELRAQVQDSERQVSASTAAAAAGAGAQQSAMAELAEMVATHTPRPAWGSLRDRAAREAVELSSDSAGESKPSINPADSTAISVVALYNSFRAARQRLSECEWLNQNEEPFFRASGDGPSVPAHLRWPAGERLRNWRLPKREVEVAVRDFWFFYASGDSRKHLAARADATASGAATPAPPAAGASEADGSRLADHFEAFLQQYGPARELPGGEKRSVREFALNIVDGCKRYRYDADMELFLEVLVGRLPKGTHGKQVEMLEALRRAFRAEDERSNGSAEGFIKRKALPGLLRRVFPTRADAEIESLVEAAGKEGGPELFYPELFKEDRDGNQSALVERVRDQWLRAPRDFVNHIEAAICCQPGSEGGLATRLQATVAISACDPKKSVEEVARLVAIGFADPAPDAPDDGGGIEVSLFCQRLLESFPLRSGRPPPTLPGMRPQRRARKQVSVRSRLPTVELAAAIATAAVSPAALSPGARKGQSAPAGAAAPGQHREERLAVVDMALQPPQA